MTTFTREPISGLMFPFFFDSNSNLNIAEHRQTKDLSFKAKSTFHFEIAYQSIEVVLFFSVLL